jgi:HSP20 family protein
VTCGRLQGYYLCTVTHLPLIFTGDPGDIRLVIQELFDELAATLPEAERGGAGECHPAIDVLETEQSIEVFVDVAGVSPAALRVIIRDGILLVVGEKASVRTSGPRTFHLVEREFGRFARAVQMSGALDVASARARVRDGELHISVPKRAERRGQTHRIPILVPEGQVNP